ncbi:MAG: cysteine desulfurase NifS [Myxococcales bacterium]|nr:MAG: cysteine desulfurase NifS [Myxococcales bacterium]
MKVYMDYNATTPVDPRVAERAIPYLKKDSFGNPSSFHTYGQEARAAVTAAREEVARTLNAPAHSVLFTSGGSEGDNHAIKGVFFARREKGNHIITTQVEHPAVLGTCEWLEKVEGARVTYLPVDRQGHLDPQQVAGAITDKTTLVTVMMANNETGVIFPIKEIAAVCRAKGVICHTDAVQAMGKLPLDVEALGVDLLSIAGHKMYAPKGVGALYFRPGTPLNNLLHGGHQEGGLRAGTENIVGIIAMGEACRIIREDLEQDRQRLTALRDRLENGILSGIPHTFVNGDRENRVCNTSNITFEFIEGEALLLALDMAGVALSSGSACASGSEEPSHVLQAMGLKPEQARASLRFSIGRFTNAEEVDYVLEKLPAIVTRLRALSPIAPH